VSAKCVWCLEHIFAVLLTFLHHLKPEKILLFITSLCCYIYHESVVETALTAVLHHKIEWKRYSRDRDPCSCIINSICMKNRVMYSSANVIRVIKWRGRVGQGVWLVWDRLEVHTGWWENIKDKRPLGGPRHSWEHNMKCTLKLDWKMWTRLS